jgi:hypothetical protein
MIKRLIITFICFLTFNEIATANDFPRTFLCYELTRGAYMRAPNWKIEDNKMSDQSVLLEYKGNNIGIISFFRGKEKYSSAEAIALTMNSGISFTSFGEEFVETLVVNVNTLELFFTKIRSGSSLLPNAMYTILGKCEPAGILSR